MLKKFLYLFDMTALSFDNDENNNNIEDDQFRFWAIEDFGEGSFGQMYLVKKITALTTLYAIKAQKATNEAHFTIMDRNIFAC